MLLADSSPLPPPPPRPPGRSLCVPGVCADTACSADVGTEGVHTALRAILHEEGGVYTCVLLCGVPFDEVSRMCLYGVVL